MARGCSRRWLPICAPVNGSASSRVKTPSSTAESKVLEAQNPVPTCMMWEGSNLASDNAISPHETLDVPGGATPVWLAKFAMKVAGVFQNGQLMFSEEKDCRAFAYPRSPRSDAESGHRVDHHPRDRWALS